MFVLYTILSLNSIQARLCDPYAFRLSLGHYYTILNYTADVLRLSFNSEGPCKSAFILTIGKNEILEYETVMIETNQMYQCENYHSFVHTFKIGMKHIEFDILIDYYVQEGDQIFGPYTFKVPRKQTYSQLLVFGNLDIEWTQNNSKSILKFLENSIFQYPTYDTILYMGNIINQQQNNYCKKGDEFIKGIESIISHYPFMISSGNLDFGIAKKQSFIKQQFQLPIIQEYGLTQMEFYSFDIGYAHFIQINPYSIIYLDSQINLLDVLEEDLQKNQNKWLIIYTYYPLQCWEKCEFSHQKLKEIINIANKYKVDLILSSFQNLYKRFKNENNSFIQIIEGVGGNYKLNETQQFGVGDLRIYNTTHLQYIHREYDTIIDEFWLVKEESQSNIYLIVLIVILVPIQFLISYRYYKRWKLQRFNQL